MAEKQPESRKALIVRSGPPLGRGAAFAGLAARQRQGGEGTITPQFLLYAVGRWWKWALPAALLMTVCGTALVFYFFVPQYQAEAWLQIYDQRPVVAFDTGDRTPEKSFVSTQIELIRSPMVLAPVIANPEIARTPEFAERQQLDLVTWLAKQIEVTQVKESQLFIISYPAADPANAARVVNAVVENYLALRGQEDSQHVERILELLNEEKEQRSAEVKRLSDVVRDLAKRVTGRDPMLSGLTNLDSRGMAQVTVDTVRSKLINAEVDRRTMEVQIKAFEDLMGKRQPRISEVVLQNAVEANPAVAALRQQVEQARKAAVEAESLLVPGKQSAYLQKTKNELASAQQSLEALRKEVAQQARAEMQAADLENQRATLDDMRVKLVSLQQTEQLLREQHDTEMRDAEKVSGDAAELFFRQEDLKMAREVLARIEDRTSRLRTEQRAPARVTQLRAALPPPVPVQSIPLRGMALVLLAGMGLPFATAIFWELTVRRVHGIQVLEQESKLAVVGEVARLPVQPRVGNRAVPRRIKQDIQVFEESIDSLRTSLLLSNEFRGLKVLAVTSAAKHEGKTSVAVQLAVSIARATGESTLLIDGDMRSPDIHNVFNIALEPGLAEVLEGKNTLDEAIYSGWSEYLHLLPAGKLRSSPHKLVGNENLKQLLGQAAARYRYVIVDTPPVLAAAEALVLTAAADACLVCAMRDVSRLEQVRKTCQRLAACGARPVGTILNGVPARTYTYHYGSYAKA